MPKRRTNPPTRKGQWSHKTQVLTVEEEEELTPNQRKLVEEEIAEQRQAMYEAAHGAFYYDQTPLQIESSQEYSQTPASTAGQKRARPVDTGPLPEPPSTSARIVDPIYVEDEPSQSAQLSTQPATPRTTQVEMPDIPPVVLNPEQPVAQGRSQIDQYTDILNSRDLNPQELAAVERAEKIMALRESWWNTKVQGRYANRGMGRERQEALLLTLRRRTAHWKTILVLENQIRRLGYTVPSTQIGTAHPMMDMTRNQTIHAMAEARRVLRGRRRQPR